MSASPSPSEEPFFRRGAILQELFDGRITAETAAPRLAAATIDTGLGQLCLGDIEGMWNSILGHLEDFPDQVQTVVDLVICVSDLPPPLSESGQPTYLEDAYRLVWKDLPALGWSVNLEWNSLDIPTDDPGRQVTFKRFEAANTVIATWILEDKEKFGLYGLFFLWTFRSALEQPLSYSSQWQHDDQICNLIAAVKLVEIAGHDMCSWDREFESGPMIGDRGKGGPLWLNSLSQEPLRWRRLLHSK